MKSQGFLLEEKTGYFRCGGVNVMAFDDFYPAGHQSGVSIIMHGKRIATCGDVRLEQTPAQWQPVPKQKNRAVDVANNSIITTLGYPDRETYLKGFNPIIYPDLELTYDVSVKGNTEGVTVEVNLEQPVPEEFAGKVCFNLELFPGELFGKSWIMDGQCGIFSRQPNGPTILQASNVLHKSILPPEGNETVTPAQLTGDGTSYNPIVADDRIAKPYAVGNRFTLCPEDPYLRLTVESARTELKLFDGRMNHNNGWFVLSSALPAKKTGTVLSWSIRPNVVEDWNYLPVVQISQVGYHPGAAKRAVIELDKEDTKRHPVILYRITEQGKQEVYRASGEEWGDFLRYRYLRFDFSAVKEEGLYCIGYGASWSSIFRIARDIYDRGVWQPVLEYFLPVQMCHMRVNEKYRVWHGLCHDDDARMAPVNRNHFDGYVQGPSTLTKYQPGEKVPGLNVGGWHDAGDFDLRIESQSGEVYILTLAYEEFGVEYDETTIDQKRKVTEIHQPDGKNDILKQIEHGVLSIVAGYRALGRLYRGIICNDLRQYVLLGDASAMTDGIAGNEDDRWVFTENNPQRELSTAAHLAAASRALQKFNEELSREALSVAKELYRITEADDRVEKAKLHAAIELYLATEEEEYKSFILMNVEKFASDMEWMGWLLCRVKDRLGEGFPEQAVETALEAVKERVEQQSLETPYGIPYRPHIWGAGWNIQSKGVQYYYLNKAFPKLFSEELVFNSLNFILGCHPGSNTASFASGIGAKSMTTAYGANRADWSYIPGGVASGTALIRPDFPELLEFPFLWQQAEYVLGGGSSNYMFLVLAARKLLKNK